MKKACVAMVFLLLISACSSDRKNNANESDGKSKFLSEHAEKMDSKSPLVIHSDGTIRYFSKHNANCSLKFDGKIESVKISDNYYTVQFRYNSFTPTVSTCLASESICQMNVQDCKTAISEYDRLIGRGHTVIFKLGEDTKNIYMIP